MSPVGQQRLEQLYEVSKLLTSFGTAEGVFDATLGVVSRSLALRSAILIEQLEDHWRMVVWPSDGDRGSGASRAAVAHLSTWFAYLVGAASSAALAVTETLGKSTLPAALEVRSPRAPGPYILIPLVVRGSQIFGAIQVEAVGFFDEADLGFISTIANQLAVAVDRDRSTRLEGRRRHEAETLTRKYESLVDNLDHVFVWEADADTVQLTFLSARAESMLGRSRQDILQQADDLRFVHPEDRSLLARTLRRVSEGEGDQRCEHRCLTGEGRVLWLHTGVHLVDSEPGRRRFQGVSIDITAEKEAQAERAFLLEATRALGATLDYGSALKSVARLAVPRLGDFCLFDMLGVDGQLRREGWAHVEPAGQRAFDRAFAAPAGGGAAHTVPDFMAEARAVLRVPVAQGGRQLGELTFAFVSSERRYGAPELALAEELAQRAAFALENGRLYEETRRAVQAREQVLEVVSHDLRNPLSVVMMATSALVSRGNSPEDQADLGTNVARIHRAGERMLALINDLLDFGSIEAGRLALRPRLCDPAQLLAEAAATSAAAAGKHIAIVVAPSTTPLPQVHCDRDRILQVIANLLDNAIKQPSKSGVITLAAEVHEHELWLSVADTGPGLSPADLTRIFERYQRGASVGYKGTGLGLSIASGIMRQHRGRLWAESELGQGATFRLALPLRRSEAPPSSPQEEPHGVV